MIYLEGRADRIVGTLNVGCEGKRGEGDMLDKLSANGHSHHRKTS